MDFRFIWSASQAINQPNNSNIWKLGPGEPQTSSFNYISSCISIFILICISILWKLLKCWLCYLEASLYSSDIFSLFKLYLISKPVTFHREWKHFEISLLCLFYHILSKCTHALDLGRFTDWWIPFDHNIFIKNFFIYWDWEKIRIKKQASSLWYLMHEVGYSNMCISPPSSN